MCDHCGCRSFAPIADLTADHERILELAWRVAEGSSPNETAARTDHDDLVALLAVHAVKEELGLYPLLVDSGDLEPDRCQALEAEHREVHDVLEQARFGRREYFALAAHIEEEEMELFSTARFAFEDEQWNDMAGAHHAALHHVGIAHSHDRSRPHLDEEVDVATGRHRGPRESPVAGRTTGV